MRRLPGRGTRGTPGSKLRGEGTCAYLVIARPRAALHRSLRTPPSASTAQVRA